MTISRKELNKIYNQHGFEILADDAVIKEGDYYQAINNGLTKFLGNHFGGMLPTLYYHHGQTSEEYQKYSNPKGLYFIRPLPKKQPKPRKQPKIYYKVVDVRGNKLFSVSWLNGVEYHVNKWVNAPGNTRLFLFDSLKAAEDFRCLNEQIYTCHAQHVAVGYGVEYNDNRTPFWNFVAEHSKGRHITKAIAKANKLFQPTRYKAVLARRVKLLEKVG